MPRLGTDLALLRRLLKMPERASAASDQQVLARGLISALRQLRAIAATEPPTDLEALVEARGDIFVATAAGTIDRFPVGTNGQIIEADDTSPTGIRWVNPSGGGGYALRLDYQNVEPTSTVGLAAMNDVVAPLNLAALGLYNTPTLAFRTV